MDVRDINVEVIYPDTNSFKDMFSLQKELLDKYMGIEGLPYYPIDINTKSSQKLVKDFCGRIIEELGEGYESYVEMLTRFNRGTPIEDLIPFLQNFNEEIADALHFWLELMIYSGHEIDSIAKWLDPINLAPGKDLLEMSLEMGGFLVNSELMFKKFVSKKVIKDKDLNDLFLCGGRDLSTEILNEYRKLLWDITYWLQLLRNTLKNKPWKQSHMMTDMELYEVYLSSAFQALFKFLYFAGFSKESIYEIYYKKNKINQFRIKSKY